MRAVFVAVLVLLAPVSLRAQQSIAPSVNNLAGLDGKLDETFVSTSIGEPAIITLQTKQGTITQGFLQPEILPCVDLAFNVFPNPTADAVTIEAMGCEVGIRSIQVIDLSGRLLNTSATPKVSKVDLSNLSDGMYVMKITLTNDDIHIVSVVKNTP